MKAHGWIAGLALGALALSLAPPVGAQTAVAPQFQQPGYRRYPPQPPIVRQLPPEPLGPNSLGLIEKGFQIMRGTSRAPNEFLYGRWNPQYQLITPPVQIQGGGGGGYYYPPNYGYPGYPYGYTPYGGYGGYPYGYQQPPVVQREVIIYGGNAPGQYGGRSNGGQYGVEAPRGTPGSAGNPSGGDFYLRNPGTGAGEAETLTGALDDLRKAWLNGDFNRFQARVRPDGKLGIFVSGEYKYAVEARDFNGMIKDAMGKIDTLAFEFDRPRSEEAGRAFVTGRHTFLDQDKLKQTTHVSYTLERIGGKWRIVEAGSASAPAAPKPAQ